jgi:RsiW-degrading membrane proteinase PrsW (M82 family)
MKIVDEILKMNPGYKSTQYIFTYYLITSNIANAFAMALLYPLPYAILFTYLGFFLEDADKNQDWDYSPLILIILTGVRASLIALLGKYAIVAP